MKSFSPQYLPKQPAQELIDWARQKLLGGTHAIVYRTAWRHDPLAEENEECVELCCSACHTISKADFVRTASCHNGYYGSPYGFYDDHGHAVIHGESTLCPICGAQVKAVYNSRVGDEYVLGECIVIDVQKIKGYLAIIYWKIQRRLNDHIQESMWACPRVAYVLDNKKINVYERSGPTWCQRHQYKDLMGKEGVVYPWKKSLLVGTYAENSKLDLYLKCKGELFPISYLRLWTQRPSVENLLVQGAGNILAEMIRRDCKGGSWGPDVVIPKLEDVNWKDPRPAQMLGISKEYFRWAISQKWKLKELELVRALLDGEAVHPETDIPLIRACGIGNVEYLIKNQTTGTIMQSVRYLVKQKKRDAITLLDYWRLVSLNGGDLLDHDTRWPQDLHRAHDAESERQRFERQQGYPKLFAERTSLLEYLTYEADGFLIRPVSSAEELFQEGKQLHHCVYSYLDRYVQKETAILLIRDVSHPDVPFFTLELNERNMHVVQNRGLRNCGKTPEVQAFEDKWLAWAKTQQKGKLKIA